MMTAESDDVDRQIRRMMTAFAGMSKTAVRLVGLAVTMPGNRARDRGGDVAVRGNSNLRPGTLAPFCSGRMVPIRPIDHRTGSPAGQSVRAHSATIDAYRQRVRIDVDDQVEAESRGRGPAKLDHPPEFPRRIHVE